MTEGDGTAGHQAAVAPDSKEETGEGNPGARGNGKTALSANDLGVWESSLEDRAGPISTWLLSFLDPFLRLGSKKVLEADDIGVPSEEDRASIAFNRVYEVWKELAAKADAEYEKAKEEHESALSKCATDEERQEIKAPVYVDPSIASALISGYGKYKFFVAILYSFMAALLGFVPVLILNSLVKLFESGKSIDEYNGVHPWVQVVGLLVLPFTISILQTRHLVLMSHAAVFVRTAVSTMLYRKSLRVSSAGRAQTSTGQVVNMMSNDTAQLQRLLLFCGMILVAPMQIIISLVLIFMQVESRYCNRLLRFYCLSL